MGSLAPTTSRFLIFTAILALLGAFFCSTPFALATGTQQFPIEQSDEAEADTLPLQSLVEEDIHLPFSVATPVLTPALTESGFPRHLNLLPQSSSFPLIRPPEHA